MPFCEPNLADRDDKTALPGICPESITGPDGETRNSRNTVRLRSLVGITESAGADTFVTMELGGRDIVARMRADAKLVSAKEFDFTINMENTVAFDPKTEKRITP